MTGVQPIAAAGDPFGLSDLRAQIDELKRRQDEERTLARDRERVAAAVADAHAPNTRRVYLSQWDRFTEWCRGRGYTSLPAEAVHLAAYLAERAETAKTSTVRLAAAAVGAAHRAAGRPDPCASSVVRSALKGIGRQHAGQPAAAPRQAAPLTYADACRLVELAAIPSRSGRGVESVASAERRGVTDAAIVALLFCAGMRRGEVSELRWADVGPTAVAGQLAVRVRQSKSNPDGGREDVRLLVNGFAGALDRLRAAADPEPFDRVVPLSPRQVNRRIQALAARAGLEGVSAHSGRRGLAHELVRARESTTAVQQAGGWRDPRMVARYASAVAVEDGAVARVFGGVR